MKRIYKRINGLLNVAKKQEASHNRIDQITGRKVARNLNMVFRILHECIVECQECRHRIELKEPGPMGETLACRMHCELVEPDGFCSKGAR